MTGAEAAQANLSLAFNEWLRRFTEEPSRYEHEFVTVGRFLEEQGQGQKPSYGDWCATYLHDIMREQREAGLAATADAAEIQVEVEVVVVHELRIDVSWD